MLDFIETLTVSLVSPGLGAGEFLVAVLVACGLGMMALSALMPKGGAGNLEWWER